MLIAFAVVPNRLLCETQTLVQRVLMHAAASTSPRLRGANRAVMLLF